MRRAILALLLVLAAGLDSSDAAAESPATSQAVSVTPLPPPPIMSLARHANGEVFFDLDDTPPPSNDRAARPRRVRVYWDHSASRADDDLAAEKSLLLYLDAVHPGIVDLVLFAGDAPELRIVEAPQEADQLADILRDLRYEGTGALHDILDLALPPADACLYFSDGVLSVDPTDAERIRCPLFAVSSAEDANRGFLRVLARRGAGVHFDLATTSADDAVAGLTGRAPRVVGVASSDGRDIEYALLPSGVDRFRIIGPLPKSGEIVVTLAGGAKKTRTYATKGILPRQQDGTGALWVVDRLHELIPQRTIAFRADPCACATLFAGGDADELSHRYRLDNQKSWPMKNARRLSESGTRPTCNP